MKRSRLRICPLESLVILLAGGLAACSDAATDASSTKLPAFQGLPGAEPSNPGGELAGTEEDAMEATPAATPTDAIDEGGVGGDIALDPAEGSEQPGAGAGSPGEMPPGAMDPAAMDPGPMTPEVPVVTGPPPKFVGNITTGNGVDTNGLTFSDYWDQITPENAGKWGSVQRQAGAAFNWAALDALYDYTQQKGILFKEHTFVWGSQQPTGNLTQADVQNWMQEFCSRYPNTRLIDVVNEPPPHTEPSYANAIGGGTNGDWQWIANAFTWAREACPNATLILNDYNNIEIGNQNQHFIDIVRAIQAKGAPIDAVGAQAHGLSGANSPANMIALLNKLHDDTGLPVYITEYDINQNDDATQLNRFQQQVSFFLDTEWIRGVTVWGWIFGRTWVANSGLIRDGAPRPAMVWLMEELGRPVPQ